MLDLARAAAGDKDMPLLHHLHAEMLVGLF